VRDVLVVDDDPAIREMIGMALELEGVPFRTATNGEEALARLAEAQPAVVLLDVNMPVLDGPGFCSLLDHRGMRDSVAIVVMTAGSQAERYERQCAADGHLGKPFDLDALYAIVEEHLRRARGE
jgi:CheY-like chemotaxis protein